MSGEKGTNPCNKFQANIFNKSKCQNCFKSRELHLLNDHGMEQAKPVYGGWLCLAPEGTDFANPMQRSRKWQRRFFILYEDGSLSFALDELPSTLPQGKVNLNLCTNIADAEPRTGQRNALGIVTPAQEIFIRGDNKEIINGWSDQLTVYLRTNKQNQKKKRKVEPVATQEPSPAKMAATDPSLPSSENAESPLGGRKTSSRAGSGVDRSTHLASDLLQGLERSCNGYLCPVSLDLVSSGNKEPGSTSQQSESNNIQTSANNKNQSQDKSHSRSTERLLGLEASEKQGARTAVSRMGRSEARTNHRETLVIKEKLQSCGDITQLTAPPPQRRAKSLDRRTSDTIMTPDLLNFKKGWMVKLDVNGQWKKSWFVLSADSLRYYKDSLAEEASHLEGEIDLTKCFNVSEFSVQRNYGFQIHTPKGLYTLSAMTSGIRKNWIQALMKNVRPAKAPDVASLPGLHSPLEALPRPDVTQDSLPTDISSERDPHPKHSSVMERRREGRNKTFDWAEFRAQNKPALDHQRTKALCPLDPKSQHKLEEEIDECWKQVEKTMFRMDRSVPLFPETEEPVELLDSYRMGMEDLQAQLAESECRRLEMEAQLTAAGCYQEQLDPPLTPESVFSPSDINVKTLNGYAQTLKDVIWLHDAEGNFTDLGDFLPETEDTSVLLSPASDSEDSFSQSDGQTDLNVATLNHQNQLDRSDCEQAPSAETQIKNSESSVLQTLEEGDDKHLNGCVEQHLPSDPELVRRLSQEVELLTSQKEALNQRNQEMLNQLTEADREIERLKVELSSRYTEPHHLPEVEQLGQTRVEVLEMEVSSREQQLLEAQTLIASLEENLRETEAMLQLNSPTEGAPQESKGYLLRCFEATEAKLTALEKQLEQSEATCRELQKQNAEQKGAETYYRESAAEAKAEVRRLNEELEKKESSKDGDKCVSGEERIRQVISGMVMRLKALDKLMEVIEKLDFGSGKEEELTVESQLKWEEQFWRLLHDKVKVNPSELKEEKPVEELLSEVTEPQDKLQLMADLHFSEHPMSGCIQSAATEAVHCYHLTRLHSKYRRQLEETKQKSLTCSNCVRLMEENRELRERLSNIEAQQLSTGDKINTGCQTEDAYQRETDIELQESIPDERGEEEEMVECPEIPLPCAEGQFGIEERADENAERNYASHKETCPVCMESEKEVLLLRRKVEELEELQVVMEEEMKEELHGKMSSVQTQHEKELEKLKATCERGFASMEESQLKVVEELQHQHQQEVELLLVERDRLLEEESAATATAIEAIKNDMCRQHSEELASYQRELEVLSQQFSLKCLESGHLVQALDAERKALCQCQQENQDLRTRNQELSSHLAAEITRLCSLAKQDALPLSQGMDRYEMEITLRVKESEVQCLKQEITSLRDDLQSAQKAKRNATKKYKDMYTELSITRAKTEREMDELRENLRLAHHALDQTSP
ncbi:Myosin phosphatase Rho-interacting protein [Dissostichus eleginoides]|uniref:Myosin phosphatase Rho-interacting protein n=1 Tax=Dissostichus eleginoides TaxID=100907 RepID=A0AAD9EX63_DISEL|nr:Myosin phosphatase Rho-interacting protein [Dissostichus eleginoides]